MTGKELIVLRNKLGYNQRELAEKLGVTTPAVNRWEHNVAPIGKPIEKLLHMFLSQKELEKVLDSK